jgi:hypothetical protein
VRRWFEDDDQFLIDTWSSLSAKQQAEALKRTLGATHKRREKLLHQFEVLSMERAKSRPWRAEDLDQLAGVCGDYTHEELAEMFSRSEAAIGKALEALGLYSGSNLMSRLQIERLFHVNNTTVAKWEPLGWLKGRITRGNGKRHHTYFHVDDVRQFVLNHPYAYNADYLRGTRFELDAAHHRRYPWLTVKQAIAVIGNISASQFRNNYVREIPGAIKVPGNARSTWKMPLDGVLHFKESYVPFDRHPIRGARKATRVESNQSRLAG